MTPHLPLPGGVGLTHLVVYDSVAPDGLAGGSPHLHLACTECYCVLAGRGRVQTLSAAGFGEQPLEPGKVLWFSPGVIHRLVNGGGLEILVVMQNGGLPEAGDFVLTFPAAVVSDAAAYRRAAALAQGDAVFATGDDAAKARRDLAVTGFGEWRAAFDRQGPDGLRPLYEAASALVAPQLPRWRQVIEAGPQRAVVETAAQLDALEAGEVAHLFRGAVADIPAPAAADGRKLGVCGTLHPYLPEGVAAS